MAEQVPSLTDERLCWLAVRDQLGKRARKPGLFGWLLIVGALGSGRSGRVGASIGGDMRREAASGKMHAYAFAVDGAAEKLTPEERRHLRATGNVPEWFLDDVETRAEARRKKK